MPDADALEVIEAAYRLEGDETSWLRGLVDAAMPLLDRGLGLHAYTIDAQAPADRRVKTMVCSPDDPEAIAFASAKVASMPPPIAEQLLRVPIGYAASSELAGPEAIARFLGANPFGIVDTAGVQGLDPSGASAWILAPSRTVIEVNESSRARWQRVAAHLAAAHRLRLALEQRGDAASDLDTADAVLETDFGVANASPRAKGALEQLRRFAEDLDRARGRLRREAPDEALELWRGLCDGTWSVVDRFDTDGRRYLVAHYNEPEARIDRALTRREEQVVAFAAMGHADKLIAYELGIAEATVQTHLASAMRKLGIPSRTELIRTVLALSTTRTDAGSSA